MSEELVTSLQSYKVQLSQVEQSLLTEPPNVDELLKLKRDLEEVISLTQSLIEPTEERAPRSVAQYLEPSTSKSQRPWKVGDRCEAYMSKENKYQVGTIKEILEDRTCCVAFGTKYSEIVQLDSLRTTKIKIDPQREHRRQKAKKYEEKVREEEKLGEDIKNKWQAFNSKMAKTKKMSKKSIFATPDTVNGRVGVGTCGIGGRPMTKFSHAEKLNKGAH